MLSPIQKTRLAPGDIVFPRIGLLAAFQAQAAAIVALMLQTAKTLSSHELNLLAALFSHRLANLATKSYLLIAIK